MGKLDFSAVLNKLKIDLPQMNTDLAQEYMNKYNATFGCLFFEPTTIISLHDNYLNLIKCADSSDLLLPDPSTSSSTEWTDISERLKRLATSIKDKSDLFCQLEWIIRCIRPEKTQQSINLIVKNLSHASADWKAAYIEEGIITMTDDAPMLILGFVAQIFKICDNPVILSTPQTAVLCHLFTELCREAGWNVQLILTDEVHNLNEFDKSHKIFPNVFNGLLPEITGIITERSDLDSAVDVFLNADPHPMPLTRILVQESVYEEFKNTVAWKSKLTNDKFNMSYDIYNEDINDLQTLCTDVFKYDDTIFLMNYAGNYTKLGSRQVVIVEAYRTVKELLSFIPKYRQLCLSVWASSLSEANEIALNADVPIIWVNDYCNFIGSDEIAKPIYKRIDSVNITVKMNTSIAKMKKKQDNWLKKTFTERCDMVLKVIKSKDLSLGDKIEPEMSNWKINNFISADNGTLILGFNIPDKTVIYNTFGAVAVPSPGFDNIIRALINGSGVIIAANPKNEEEIFIAFEMEGIPVAFVDDTDTTETELRVPLGDSWCFQTKVIWSNFGTSFAN